MTPLGNFSCRPIQVTIARFEMQGSRAEGQYRHPFSTILGDVTQHSPNRIGVAQVVFLVEKIVMPTPILLTLN